MIKYIALLLSFIYAASAAAHGERIKAILDQPLRPTMEQVLEIFHEIHDEDGIPVSAHAASGYYDQRLDIPGWLKLLLKNGPRLIVEFEKTYPGATWVFLGRDGLPWADLFEAFYTDLGQPNRVVRIGISKPSMENVSDETLLNLMRDAGVPVDTLDQAHPTIFIDSVSGGYGRQGRRLMAALFKAWTESGRDPLAILDKVDMIGLMVSTFQGVPNDIRFKELHQYLQALLLIDTESWGPWSGDDLFSHLRIMTVNRMGDASNEAGYTHFIGAWHDSFGKIRRSKGETKAVPGEQYPEQMKKSVLWQQKKIWQFVRTGNCLQAVQQWAARSGFEFPVKRPAAVKADPKMLAKFREKIGSRGDIVNHGIVALDGVLRSQGASVQSRQALLQLFSYSINLPGTASVLKEKAEPKTALADIQYLARALRGGSNCESMLAGDR